MTPNTVEPRLDTGTSARPTLGPIVYLLTGPLIWAAHFAVLYGLQSTLCAVAPEHMSGGAYWLYFVIGSITILAVLCLVVPLRWPRRFQDLAGVAGLSAETRDTLQRIFAGLVVVSLFGLIAAAATSVALPVCHSGR